MDGRRQDDVGVVPRLDAADAVAPRYQPLVTVVLAMAAGIVVSRYGGAAFGATWLIAVGCLAAWWWAWRRGQRAASAWLLLGAVATGGAAWHDLRWNGFTHDEIARFAEHDAGPACVAAIARGRSELIPAPQPTALRAIPTGERSRLQVAVVGIRDGAAWRPAGGRCQLVVDGRLDGMRAGDRLQVFGQLGRSMPPRNPGQFDFAARDRVDGRLTSLRSIAPECVTVVEPAGAWRPYRLLEWVQASGRRTVERYVGSGRAPLASAILLGARDGMPSDDTAPFFLTGTIHVLVVSGLHVGILALGLYGLMRLGWLQRRTALAVIAALVVSFALVAEARPPVVRAAVLGVVLCAAAWTGRHGVRFNALAFAALFILAVNPAELFRAGTQLSFLSVATLIWNHEQLPIRLWLRGRPDRLDQLIAGTRPWYVRAVRAMAHWFGWLFVATLVVWLVALPLVMYQFHVMTPVAPLISPAVWLLVFAALWSGFSMLLCGWLLPPLAGPLGALCNLSLGGLEGVVTWAEALPGGHFWVPGPALWWVIGVYAGLLAAMLGGRTWVAPRWQVATLAVWILIGLAPALARDWTRGDELRCSFVAVGHGTCVVLELPDGETIVYDAGSLGSPEFATRTIAAYLWQRGITRIEAIVVSHPDIDHYNAVPGLLERFHVGAVYVSPLMFNSYDLSHTTAGPAELRAAIARAGVPLREIWAGDRLRVASDVQIDVLHPPRRGVVGSDNANSITLAVEYNGQRLLLPGDLESPGLEQLLAELPYDADIAMAPHHGSRSSDPPGFAAWCTPDYVVISGGSGDVVPVVETYEAAGATVLHTHHMGAVEFSLGRGPLQVATWWQNAP